MKYPELPEDVRAALEAKKMCAVRYSSKAGVPRDTVDDAILLSRGTSMVTDLLNGYTVHNVVAPWFDFVAEGKSDEEAVRMAKEAAEMWDVPPVDTSLAV